MLEHLFTLGFDFLVQLAPPSNPTGTQQTIECRSGTISYANAQTIWYHMFLIWSVAFVTRMIIYLMIKK